MKKRLATLRDPYILIAGRYKLPSFTRLIFALRGIA